MSSGSASTSARSASRWLSPAFGGRRRVRGARKATRPAAQAGGFQGGFADPAKAAAAAAPGTPIGVWFAGEARVGQQGSLTRVRAGQAGLATARTKGPPLTPAWPSGAVCPERRTGAAVVTPEANAGAMEAHLAGIGRDASPGAHAALVLDGAGWHGSARPRVPGNVSLLPLPRHAPELNPVENVREYLRQDWIGRRVWDGYDAIAEACRNAWNTLMRRPEQQTRADRTHHHPRLGTGQTLGRLV